MIIPKKIYLTELDCVEECLPLEIRSFKTKKFTTRIVVLLITSWNKIVVDQHRLHRSMQTKERLRFFLRFLSMENILQRISRNYQRQKSKTLSIHYKARSWLMELWKSFLQRLKKSLRHQIYIKALRWISPRQVYSE